MRVAVVPNYADILIKTLRKFEVHLRMNDNIVITQTWPNLGAAPRPSSNASRITDWTSSSSHSSGGHARAINGDSESAEARLENLLCSELLAGQYTGQDSQWSTMKSSQLVAEDGIVRNLDL